MNASVVTGAIVPASAPIAPTAGIRRSPRVVDTYDTDGRTTAGVPMAGDPWFDHVGGGLLTRRACQYAAALALQRGLLSGDLSHLHAHYDGQATVVFVSREPAPVEVARLTVSVQVLAFRPQRPALPAPDPRTGAPARSPVRREKPGTISCAVPFCRCRRGLRKADRGVMPREWVCRAHWAGVPAALKAEKRRCESLCRTAKRRGRATARLSARVWRAWERCRNAAIEAAAGIS